MKMEKWRQQMNDGPLTWEMDSGFEHAIRQELVTYSVHQGRVIRLTVIRTYTPSRDYNDSVSTVVLVG
jgi:hypothetical protein